MFSIAKPNICICADGKIAPRCSDSAPDTGGCTATCLNGGTCRGDTCACRAGYAGEHCQEPVCRKQCSNGGRCIGPNRLELARKVHPKVLYHGEGPSVITNLRFKL